MSLVPFHWQRLSLAIVCVKGRRKQVWGKPQLLRTATGIGTVHIVARLLDARQPTPFLGGIVKEFDLALKQLSLTHLRRIAAQHKKNTQACEDKGDYIHLLSATMTKNQKHELLATQLLAGRTSMALVKFEADPFANDDLRPNFQVATAIPTVVHVGKRDELVENQTHILWAMLDGNANFIDPHLEVQIEPRAMLVDTFYDHADEVLQLRAGFSAARKITREFAKMQGVDDSTQTTQLGIKTRQQLNDFANLLEARVVKCKGEKKQPKGFIIVTGETDASDDIDARDTPDYKEHAATTDPINEEIRFEYHGKDVKIGIGFDTSSIVFRSGVDEETMQHVYGTLKEFLLK